MKKRIILALFLITAGVSVFAATTYKKGQTAYVKTKTATLKNGDGNFAKDVGSLSYGDQVKVLDVSGKKVQVQLSSGAKSGWVDAGNLTKNKITKTASGGTVSASTKELALAGKGFSEESEGVYSASHRNLDFSAVDAIEAMTISDSELEYFIDEGHLKGAE